jgi:Rap1a immunity proteins
MRLPIISSLCLLAATTAYAAGWATKATDMWGACARALRTDVTVTDGFNSGLCYGTINAIMFARDDICLPEGVSREQASRVVVRYFETHPELLHLDGVGLVETALREAWPCRR